ncbi:CRTAC1 family protein [Paenibacillus sambharensis]|uniref:CRTAC1 family protein n=1 Tax=Paenibacillus sambharensis TaxID=1803190 RepID=A0A2W1LU65_9BACL|nr:CRTAC1 family protein [Paenibacillus sambharensis]PZD95321.1 CRTAC1 family protein [Paenibacillus sambharensis]
MLLNKNKRIVYTAVALLSILVTGCTSQSKPVSHGFSFEDVTEESGITFAHAKDTFDPKVANIFQWLASTGAGVAAADYDADGWMDLYFINSKRGEANALYRNKGDGTFEEVAAAAGVADVNTHGMSESVVWFDYNNSGYPSLFIGSWGKSKLFRNNGDGTFTEITDTAGVGYNGYVNKVITLDYNRDGFLDLYLGCYFRETDDLWNLNSTRIMHSDFERARNGGANVLYRNNGDGTFTDVSAELGVDDTGWTLATGSADLNRDGWPDLYNANDFGPDSLLLNQDGKGFKKVVQKRGIGDDTFKGMNVDFADLFHDGRLAFYVSNISKETYLLEGNQLWHEGKDGVFRDHAPDLGLKQSGFSWGARFLDVNNSGEMSLMVTNGFISASKKRDYWYDMGILATTPGDIVEDTKNWPDFEDKSMSGHEQKKLFLNDGQTFTDVAQDVGITFTEDARGVSAVDLWNRGSLDLVFAVQDGPARVYKNHNETGHHWIKLHLIGTPPSNRDAVGAKVTFTVNGVSTVIERDGGNSHGGQSDPRIHFGLKEATAVDSIRIEWPSGRVEELGDVPIDRITTIVEGAAAE